MTSFNTGATASAVTATSVNLSIPAGVLAGDLMWLALTLHTEVNTQPAVSFAGGGGGWTLVSMTNASVNPQDPNDGALVFDWCYAYYRVATAGDIGATLTISETGSAAGTTWISAAMAAYTGAKATQADVAGGASRQGNGILNVTCPTLNTGVAGDWSVFLGGGAPGVGASFVGPAGSTQRESVVSSAGVAAGIWDSNGSVGGAGTPIGGGTVSTGNSGVIWMSAFTIGMAPPPPPAVVAGGNQLTAGRTMMKKWLQYADL